MREGKTGVATRKILATQKSAMGWTLFLSNLLALALGLGCLALYYMRLYAGSWAALGGAGRYRLLAPCGELRSPAI